MAAKPVVVGVDGSEESMLAAEWAYRMRCGPDAWLVLQPISAAPRMGWPVGRCSGLPLALLVVADLALLSQEPARRCHAKQGRWPHPAVTSRPFCLPVPMFAGPAQPPTGHDRGCSGRGYQVPGAQDSRPSLASWATCTAPVSSSLWPTAETLQPGLRTGPRSVRYRGRGRRRDTRRSRRRLPCSCLGLKRYSRNGSRAGRSTPTSAASALDALRHGTGQGES
jgi:hypothetical protein